MDVTEALEQVRNLDRLLLSEPDIAALCSVSRPTVHRWIKEGLLQRVELPFGTRRNLYRRADVEELVSGLALESVAAVR